MLQTNILKQKAREFIENYKNRHSEKSDAQSFWIDFLSIFIDNATQKIKFEDPVKLSHTSFMDGYIPYARVLIEHKKIGVNLDKKYKQSDGSELTPFEQAKRYNTELGLSQKAKFIIVCNFAEFRIHDMEHPSAAPYIIKFDELENEIHRFSFLEPSSQDEDADLRALELKKQNHLSFKAAHIIRKIQDELMRVYEKENGEITADDHASINMFLTRLVFCFYAEDSGVFPIKDMFGHYLAAHKDDMRDAVLKIFEMLNTKTELRDKYIKDKELLEFPYTNGGLFENNDKNIPQFSAELQRLIIDEASYGFDWQDISPTIFGGLFESTLNPETRRSGGMHYTSVENIEKLIRPLFLDDLENKLNEILKLKTKSIRDEKLVEFQKYLGSLTFLDPACGSGNFLTQTYICLRELENKAIKARFTDEKGNIQGVLGNDFINDGIFVDINNFYGIEINDFASAVAKTALNIASAQMLKITSTLINQNLEFLPLKSFENILCANALKCEWDKLIANPSYIIGNPPFIGHQYRSKEQSLEMDEVFKGVNDYGKLDYVCAWFFKACEMMENSRFTRTAFVATNSICQGESVALLWKPLFEKGIKIHFAYRSFKWDNSVEFESGKKQKSDKKMAAVHVIIVNFDFCDISKNFIFTENSRIPAQNINGYLLDAPNVFIQNRGKPLNKNLSKMSKGSQPTDGGNLLLSSDERDEILAKYPNAEKFIKQFMGAEEFINNKLRYCLWLVDANPSELSKIPPIMTRLENVRQMRLKSPTKSVQEAANTPTLFTQIRQPNSDFLVVPEVSSESRFYVPIGFLSKEVIVGNSIQIVKNAILADFAILTSSVHMEWMRIVAGRLETRYRYTPAIYNNFPFASLDEKAKEILTKTAQGILDARTAFAEASLADLYNPLTMPPALLKAHKENDKAVLNLYNLPANADQEQIIKELFARYEKLS